MIRHNPSLLPIHAPTIATIRRNRQVLLTFVQVPRKLTILLNLQGGRNADIANASVVRKRFFRSEVVLDQVVILDGLAEVLGGISRAFAFGFCATAGALHFVLLGIAQFERVRVRV